MGKSCRISCSCGLQAWMTFEKMYASHRLQAHLFSMEIRGAQYVTNVRVRNERGGAEVHLLKLSSTAAPPIFMSQPR